jgi:hypothetical protein
MVELLVASAVTGVIMPALAGAMVIGWRTTDSTVDHLADTGNRQRVQAFFVRDMQSARTVDTSSADTTCTSAGDTLIVRLRWSETVSGATVNRVATYVRAGTSPDVQLVRRTCDGSSAASSVTVAHRTTAVPTVTCYDGTGAVTSPTCASVARAVLTVTDASGVFTANGRRRSTS